MSSAFSACLESRRVCWQTTGTSDSIPLAKSSPFGIGSGSSSSSNRKCLLLEDDAEGPKTVLHPSATDCGRNARESGAGTLVLSHIGRDDPDDLETALETVRDEYDGRIVVLRNLLDVYPDGRVVDTRQSHENRDTGATETTHGGPDVIVVDEHAEP